MSNKYEREFFIYVKETYAYETERLNCNDIFLANWQKYSSLRSVFRIQTF